MADASYYAGRELEVLSATWRYQAWIVEGFSGLPQGRVAEIGAGTGAMVRHWLRHSTDLHLIEPAHNLFEALQREYGAHPGVALYRGTLDEVVDTLPQGGEQAFDSVVTVVVLEHIADDRQALRQVYRPLKPGGHLLLFVPALPALFGSLDEIFGHCRRYTPAALLEAVVDSQFAILESRYFDFLGVLPWWLVGRVFRAKTISPVLAGVYDRWAVPVGRFLEIRITPPIGKNLILAARKEAK